MRYSRQIGGSALINTRISQLVDGFGRYVQAYDGHVSFTSEQLAAHRATVDLRQQAGSVRAAVGSEQFLVSLRRTLLAWGIGRRASRLVPADAFAAALHAVLPRLEPLGSLRIDGNELPGDLAGTLAQLIGSLGVVTNKAKLVAGTKTLHHLLPDLVPPMDRAWTGCSSSSTCPDGRTRGASAGPSSLPTAASPASRGKSAPSST